MYQKYRWSDILLASLSYIHVFRDFYLHLALREVEILGCEVDHEGAKIRCHSNHLETYWRFLYIYETMNYGTIHFLSLFVFFATNYILLLVAEGDIKSTGIHSLLDEKFV